MPGHTLDLIPIWTGILGLAVFIYVLLDGFDLGVGILYGFAREDARPTLMSSIAPIWDGNETWLILGGMGLFAAFPLAFAIIIPAVYFPILLMLLGLVFRGAAFEFRFQKPRLKRFWDGAFAVGSTVATFAQGTVLGAYIQGFQVEGRDFSGTSWDWLTPFSLLTGVALVLGYSLLGAGWLILKTEGAIQRWARKAGKVSLLGVLLAIAIVSIWTPLLDPQIASRWFSAPNIYYLAPVPIVTGALAVLEWVMLSGDDEVQPFVIAIGLFFMSYLGIAISLFPMVVPHRYDLWQAASSEDTQAFLLIGTLFLLPIVLIYSGWSYWVFRGKVKGDHFYH